MAVLCVDEAIRNAVAVGADPDRIALLDNFCWGNPERPETLGSLVMAAKGCHDAAIAYGTPVHLGQGQPLQRVRAPGEQAGHPAHAAHQRHRPRAGRAQVRDDGPEGAGEPALCLWGTRGMISAAPSGPT